MLEHSRVRELFSDYLDGELEEKTVRQVEGHLKNCEECRSQFISLKQTVAAVSSLEPVRAPEGFASKVHSRLRRRVRHRPQMSSTLEHKIPYETICLIMLAILAALYIVFYLLPLMSVEMSYQGSEQGVKRDQTDRKQEKPRAHPPRSAIYPRKQTR